MLGEQETLQANSQPCRFHANGLRLSESVTLEVKWKDSDPSLERRLIFCRPSHWGSTDSKHGPPGQWTEDMLHPPWAIAWTQRHPTTMYSRTSHPISERLWTLVCYPRKDATEKQEQQPTREKPCRWSVKSSPCLALCKMIRIGSESHASGSAPPPKSLTSTQVFPVHPSSHLPPEKTIPSILTLELLFSRIPVVISYILNLAFLPSLLCSLHRWTQQTPPKCQDGLGKGTAQAETT